MHYLLGLIIALLALANCAIAQVTMPYRAPVGTLVAIPYTPVCGNLVDILTSQVVTNTCVAPSCGGTSVGGACWYASTTNCDDACASHGSYDPATLNYAGSSGTNANCTAVYQAVTGDTTLTATATNSPPLSNGVGCFFVPGGRGGGSLSRDTSAATTSAASMTSTPRSGSVNYGTRYCACSQ